MAQQQNAVINGTLTFTGTFAGQASIQAQPIGGNLIFQLPNQLPVVNQTMSVESVSGNVVTLGFGASSSSSISTSQLASVEGTGDKVQLTTGVAASPVTSKLGSAAEYAILAYSGITNTGASVITGGNIGSAPTPGPQAGFTFTAPAAIDNANAGAARTAGNAAFAYYSALTPTQTGLANLSTNNGGGGAGHYYAGVFAGGALDIPTSITLDGQGNPNALFVFVSASTTILESGASVLLINGAQASNVVWCVGSSFTQIGDNNTMVGNILAYTSITLDGGTLNGRALAVGGGNGAVTIAAAEAITATVGTGSPIAGDVVIYDGFGNVIDSGILLSSLGGAAGVTSFNGRSGVVVPLTGDYSAFYDAIGAAAAAQTAAETFATSADTTVLSSAETFSSNASNLTSGTVASARLTGSYAISISGNAATATSATTATTATSADAVQAVVVSATPPTTGQVLTATSATAANWQTPAGGGGSPGGSSGQIQWNNASTFAGAAGSTVTSTGVTAITAGTGGLAISCSGTSDSVTITSGGSTSIFTVGGTGSGSSLQSQNAEFSIASNGSVTIQAGNTNGTITIASGATAGISITPGSGDTVVVTNFRTVGEFLDSNNSSGTTGQVLTTNGSVATWQTPTGGAVSFDQVTTGLNNGGNTLQIGNSSSLSYTGSGVINANQLGGVAFGSYALLAGPTFSGTVTIPTLNVGTALQVTGNLDVFGALVDGGAQQGVAGMFLASTNGSVLWKSIFQNNVGTQAAAADSHTASGTVTINGTTPVAVTLSASAQFSSGTTYVVHVSYNSTPGGAQTGVLYVTTQTTSGFNITSTDATDTTSTIAWTAVGF